MLLADVLFTDEPGEKRRPVLVVSTTAYNRASDHIVYLPITSSAAPAGDYVRMALDAGSMPKESNLRLDRLQTMSERRIAKRLGRAHPDVLRRALQAAHGLLERPAPATAAGQARPTSR